MSRHWGLHQRWGALTRVGINCPGGAVLYDHGHPSVSTVVIPSPSPTVHTAPTAATSLVCADTVTSKLLLLSLPQTLPPP